MTIHKRRTHLGTINVETGTVTMGDPCYSDRLMDKFNTNAGRMATDWQGVDAATLQLIPSPLNRNKFVAFPPNCLTVAPGWGDGQYDVFGTFVTIPPSLPGDTAYERLAKVEIVFIEEEGETEER